jgi:chromo domain-containing protein 1
MSDEEDDVSVTSTVESEQQSEYEVERILAETQLDGAKTYLVRWAHYPIERSTWEPADSFYDPQTLTDWEKTKELVENGKREAFDLDAFSKHLDALERASAKRRSKREAKRRRLGYYGDSAGIQEDAAASLSPPTANSPPKESSQAFVAPRPPQALPPDNSRVRTVADKPPVAVFGNSESAPSGPLRRKKPAEHESAKRFKLSTMRSYEKAKSYEPAPNVSQLERWRPSEWPSAASDAAGLGNKPVRSLEGQVPTTSARESDDLFVNPGSGSPGPAVGSPITQREVQDYRDSGTGHPLPEPSTERHVATRDHQAEAGRTSDYARGRELERNRPLRLPRRNPQPGSYKMKDRFWNRGEVLIHMFYGPDKTEIGSARICGLPPQYKKRLVDTKKTPRFDLWFQHLCTYEEYSILCEEVSQPSRTTLYLLIQLPTNPVARQYKALQRLDRGIRRH